VSRPTGSQDSEKTVSVAGTQETASLADPTVADQAESAPVLPSSPVTLLPMASEVGAPIGQEPSMGVAWTSLPAPSPGAGVGHFMYDVRLEEVLKALDPAHRLAEFTSS
jgi:hypothetical protein